MDIINNILLSVITFMTILHSCMYNGNESSVSVDPIQWSFVLFNVHASSTKVLYTMHLLLWWSILGAASVSFFSNHWLNGVLPSLHARLSKWKLVPLISIEGINKAILYSKSSWQIAEYKRRTTTSITFFWVNK